MRNFIFILSLSFALSFKAVANLSIVDFPESLGFNNFSLSKTGGGVFDLGTSQWVKGQAWDYGPSYRGAEYRLPAAGTYPDYSPVNGANTFIRFEQTDSGISLNVVSLNSGDGSFLLLASYRGTSLSDLALVASTGVDNPPESFNPSWFSNGLSPSGEFPVGGLYVPFFIPQLPFHFLEKAAVCTQGLTLQVGEFQVLP